MIGKSCYCPKCCDCADWGEISNVLTKEKAEEIKLLRKKLSYSAIKFGEQLSLNVFNQNMNPKEGQG